MPKSRAFSASVATWVADFGIVDAVRAVGRRHVVVDDGEGLLRAGAPCGPTTRRPSKACGRRHLVDEVAVDIEEARAVGLRVDHVVVPDLVVERAGLGHALVQRSGRFDPVFSRCGVSREGDGRRASACNGKARLDGRACGVPGCGAVTRPRPALLARALGALGDAGRLAAAVAQVIELGPAHGAAAHDLDGIDHRRIEREDALDALAVGDLADREALLEAAAGAGDADALVGLHAGALAFLDLDVDDHGVARLEIRDRLVRAWRSAPARALR